MTDFKQTLDKKRTKSTNFKAQNFEHGKLPPQAVELEEAVLGALMLEKESLNTAIDILQPVSFYKEAHQRIFSCIQELFQKSEPIDILTVTQELRKNGWLEIVGGAYYISQLTTRIASAANIESHSRIIAQKYIQRELIRISTDIITDAYNETTDVFELLDRAETNLFGVAEGNLKKNYEELSKLLSAAIDKIQQTNNTNKLSGIPSGFTALDRVTSGWQNSDLIIVAARPAMGKTAYVLSLARNAAVINDSPVAIFSLEMSSIQLVTRLISAESGISSENLRKGSLRPDELQQIHTKINRLSNAKIYIDDTPGLSVFDLRAKARRLKSKHNIQLIIIDYLQLMSGGGDGKNGNREQEISMISRSLKSIAKELNVPVIALSQLSRAVETRAGDKKPQLSDLRESGSIEQDADMVQFIHRPEYYGLGTDSDGTSTQNLANIIIAKHRNGAVCEVKLKFINQLAKFEDFDHIEQKDDYQENSESNNLSANNNFDSEQYTVIKPSKMDDLNEDEDNNFPSRQNEDFF